MSTIQWQYFPKSDEIPLHLLDLVGAFEINQNKINSFLHNLKSDEVLQILFQSLENLHFKVEKGKRKIDKINVPALFGQNGKLEKYFDADGYNKSTKTVIEIEARQGCN
ncbi:MAG: hypothetical protein ACSHXF_02045 [Aquaticitalea sp.]